MKLGFPSIRQASENARVALIRFPLVLACGVLAAVIAMVLVESGDEDWSKIRLLLTAMLGLPLFVAIETLRERRRWSAAVRAGLLAGGVVVLASFWFLSGDWTQTLLLTRWVQLAVAFHLLVAFVPFTGYAAKQSFWQYNRILFLRFLLAALYAVVLFAGLAVALLALDNLFNVNIDGEAYAHLWFVLAFVFDPWFFLGSLPRDIEALEARTDYPTGLKVFAQFVLIPVVTVYVLILSAYLVRVLVTRTWPSGWIGWLVSSVAAAGTLALLLVHPVREREDSRWVDAYGRWFFVALLPSIGMLLMAIWQRLGQYGFTERRYFLLILAVWLAVIALYYGITASRNIRLIPVTLCAVALATLAGPWSAYGVSRNSQASRLEGLLLSQGMLADGAIDTSPAAGAPDEVQREVSATVRYLVETHGIESLDDVSPVLRANAGIADTTLAKRTMSDNEIAQHVVENSIGMAYYTRWAATLPIEEYVNFYTEPYGRIFDIADFDVLVRIELARPDTTRVPVSGDTVAVIITRDPVTIRFVRDGELLATTALWPLLDEARAASIDLVRSQPGMPRGGAEPIELSGGDAGFRYRILVTSLSGQGRGEAGQINSALADVLLSVGAR